MKNPRHFAQPDLWYPHKCIQASSHRAVAVTRGGLVTVSVTAREDPGSELVSPSITGVLGYRRWVDYSVCGYPDGSSYPFLSDRLTALAEPAGVRVFLGGDLLYITPYTQPLRTHMALWDYDRGGRCLIGGADRGPAVEGLVTC